VQEINKIFSNSVEGQKKYIAPLLYAGIAKYNDKNWSKVLINKHIDDIAKAFIGSPIVEGHNQPTGDTDPSVLGAVDEVLCNGEGFTLKYGTSIKRDCKYYCSFVPRNGKEQECEEAVKRTGFISTSYLAEEVIEPKNGEKLEYINMPYDVEIKSIEPRHVALVTAPRYEEAVIYENQKETNMDIESKIEIEKGVFVSFFSSAAEKGKELIAGIFDNAKKKKDNMSDEEAKKDLEKLKKHEEEEIKEEKKDNSKKKKNNSEEKPRGWVGEKEEDNEEKKEEKDNSDGEEEMDNSVEVDGEKVSMDDLKNCWKNSKKSNEKLKENSKEEASKDEVSLEDIEAKSFNNSTSAKSFKIGVPEFGYNEFFNSKK